MLVLEFGSILLMLKICDSLSHGAELKLMKICGGKTFAGLHVEHQDSCSEAMVTKDRRHEQVPKQRTPFRAMLTISGCLGVLGVGRVGTGTVIGPSPVLPVCYLTSDPPRRTCQWVGTQILRNTWEVCAWQVSERGLCGMP